MVNIAKAETPYNWSCPALAPTVTYTVAGGKSPSFAKNVSTSPGMTAARALSMTATVTASEHTITPAPRAVCENTFRNMISFNHECSLQYPAAYARAWTRAVEVTIRPVAYHPKVDQNVD
jgi:hypothetical protein